MGQPLFLFKGNGSMAYRSRAGTGSMTSSGAVRYRAAEGARTNLIKNPRFATDAVGWFATGGDAAIARITTDSPDGRGTCLQLTVSSIDNGTRPLTTSPSNNGVGQVLGGTGTYTYSFWAKLVSGASDYYVGFRALNAGGSTVSENSPHTDITITDSWQRFTVTKTLDGTAGVHFLSPRILRKTAAASVILIGNAQLESGSSATQYFDGSTGGTWLDPITGILGTAHASPSVSQAVAWVEEGTTNTIPDPSFENATITNYWTAQGSGAISKVTTHAYDSSNGGKVVCSASTSDGIHQLATSGAAASNGQSWTLSGRIRAFAAADVGDVVKPAIIERTSGDAVVATNLGSSITLTDAWQEFTYTVTLAGGGTVAKVTMGMMNGAAAACDWVIDALQLENKAYATSFCQGSLGTGYAWSGTAHASASTRTACAIRLPESASLVMPAASGSIFARVTRTIDGGGTSEILAFGDYNQANKDSLQLYVSTGDLLTAAWRYGTVSQVTPQIAGSVAVGTEYFVGTTWDGVNMDLWRGSSQATPITNRLYYDNTDSTTDYIGIGCTPAGAAQFNGGIGPVAITDMPLDDRERAILSRLKQWEWDTIHPILTKTAVDLSIAA